MFIFALAVNIIAFLLPAGQKVVYSPILYFKEAIFFVNPR